MVYLERKSFVWEPSPEYIEPASIQMWSREREYTQVHVPAHGCVQTGRVEKGYRDLHIRSRMHAQEEKQKVFSCSAVAF